VTLPLLWRAPDSVLLLLLSIGGSLGDAPPLNDTWRTFFERFFTSPGTTRILDFLSLEFFQPVRLAIGSKGFWITPSFPAFSLFRSLLFGRNRTLFLLGIVFFFFPGEMLSVGALTRFPPMFF